MQAKPRDGLFARLSKTRESQTSGLSSLSVTKLDGTAKGGIIIALAEKYGLPIHFVSVREGMEDFRPFNAQDFARVRCCLKNWGNRLQSRHKLPGPVNHYSFTA